MNSTLSKVIIFAAGAAIGSAVTWKLVKTKYEQIANDEIAEMREYVRSKQEPKEASEPEKSIVDIQEADANEYVNALSNYMRSVDVSKAASYSYVEKEEKGGAEEVEEEYKPYVITPDDYGEEEDYDTVTLTYYADGVVEDDQCNIMHNPEEILGEGFADHFGEFTEDSVYVRNDQLKIDYEILYDLRTYADANTVGSYMDDE